MPHKNIVIADDDPAILLMVSAGLKRLGFVVTTAANGSEALHRITQNPAACDILITDHSMPEMTGLELVGHLRKEGFTGKIVVMSGSLDGELEAAYKARSVNKILQKPFKMETLALALEDLFITEKEATGSHRKSH